LSRSKYACFFLHSHVASQVDAKGEEPYFKGDKDYENSVEDLVDYAKDEAKVACGFFEQAYRYEDKE
jgi:hypothetical protein